MAVPANYTAVSPWCCQCPARGAQRRAFTPCAVQALRSGDVIAGPGQRSLAMGGCHGSWRRRRRYRCNCSVLAHCANTTPVPGGSSRGRWDGRERSANNLSLEV